MKDAPASPFLRRVSATWKRLKAVRAAHKGLYDRAIQLLDEAAEMEPLRASNRVYRADLLLGAHRTGEAHAAFAALRNEFRGSRDPNLEYLRHYCTHQLSVLTPGSGQWGYEAKQAKHVKCSALLKVRFPMVTVDGIHDRIKPRR